MALGAFSPVEQVIAHRKQRGEDLEDHWFAAPPGRLHEHVLRVVKRLVDDGQERSAMRLKCARLYGNREIMGFKPAEYARSARERRGDRLAWNVCKSCVDTAAAKISKNKPRALFLTEDGNADLSDRAKALTEFCDGMFELAGAYPAAQAAFRDSLVFDAGAVKVCVDPDEDEVRWERVFIDDLRIDEQESRDGVLLQIHHDRPVDTTRLLGWVDAGMFDPCEDGEAESEDDDAETDEDAADGDEEKPAKRVGADVEAHREKLRRAIIAASTQTQGAGRRATVSSVRVVESWRVAMGDTPGRHTMVIDGADLLDEGWEFPWVPFMFLTWTPPLIGFLGQGLIEELIGIQVEINKLLRTIQQAQELACVPRVYIDASTTITKELDDEIMGHHKYVGRPPVISTAPAMPGEVYSHLERLKQSAYELTGISMLSAQSKKPAGLDAAVALREFQDIESERFILQGQRFEQAFMTGTRMSLELLRKRLRDGADVEMRGRDGEYIKRLRLKDIDLDEAKYEMRCFPVSFLPSTPAGRLQMVKELIADGFISDRSEALSLLDFPDLKRFVSLQTAALDDVRMMLTSITERKEYIAPDRYTNLALAQRLARSTLLRARHERRDQEVLDLLQQFEDEVVTLLEESAAAAGGPAAPPPNGGPPPAGPDGPGGQPMVPMGEAAPPPLVPQMDQPVMAAA